MNVLKMMVLGVMVFPVFGVYASEKENEKMTLRKNHTLFNSDHLITTGYTTLKKKYQKQPTLII